MDNSFNPTLFMNLFSSSNSCHSTTTSTLEFDSNPINMLLGEDDNQDFLFETIEDESSLEESDTVKEGQETQQETDGSLHPISCTRCRKMHKFCTRTKPSCTRCSAKGIPCEYREPRKLINKSRTEPSSTKLKRKRENLSVDDNSIEPSSPNKKVSNMQSLHVNSMEFLPWYFSNPLKLNFFISFLLGSSSKQTVCEKEELDSLIIQYESCGVSDSNKIERNAFFYSLQAVSYQSRGEQEQAQQALNKSKKYISKSCEPLSILNSYTYLNLSLFEMGSGELRFSKFHLHCAKYYPQNIMKPILTIQETRALKTISFIESFSLQEIDVLQFSSSLPMLYEMATGIQLHPHIANPLLQSITMENHVEVMKTGMEVIKLLISNIRDKILNNSKDIPDEQLSGLLFTQDILTEGLRMGIMVSITSRKDLIEEASLKITYLSQKEHFSNCSMFMIPFFVMAARVNLQVVKSIEGGLRSNNQIGRGPNGGFIPVDYYNILKMNQRSLTCLNSRFSRISIVHDKLLENIETILSFNRSV